MIVKASKNPQTKQNQLGMCTFCSKAAVDVATSLNVPVCVMCFARFTGRLPPDEEERLQKRKPKVPANPFDAFLVEKYQQGESPYTLALRELRRICEGVCGINPYTTNPKFHDCAPACKVYRVHRNVEFHHSRGWDSALEGLIASLRHIKIPKEVKKENG